MYFVEKPLCRPNHCAVTPFVHQDDEGFIDTRSELPGFDNHVYVSVKSFRAMLKFLREKRGLMFATPEEHTALLEKLEHRHREINDLKDQLAEADRELNAVEVLRQSGNWAQGKRAGRPRKERVEA